MPGVLVGTSGWQYRDWRGAFYPQRLPTARWLEHYAATFDTVEVNSTFYRLPSRDTVARWAACTPEDFSFVLKASRYLTHVKRLHDPADAVARLLEVAEPLGARLAGVLVQLPPTLPRAIDRLATTLDAFPRGLRIAIEVRHASWWETDELVALLRAEDAALVVADRLGPLAPIERTASWCYLRFHEGRASPPPCYGRQALATWWARLRERWGPRVDGFVFFNNDPHACAVRNARTFRRLVTAAPG